MTTESLVTSAMEGDAEAFGQLVTRYQGMAFSYALATTRDYHLAEDATQQAMIVAYRNLAALRDPRRFGGWLRGIVRFESLRILRDRDRTDSLDGDESREPIDAAVDLERQAEVAVEFERVSALMAQLPERQRVVAQLYYLGDRSQAAVAEFLGLSVSAVNNRLREARSILRQEGAHIMSDTPINTPDFAASVGKVIQAGGVTIDARMERSSLPPLLTAVEIGDRDRSVTAFVAQYLNDDVARLVAIDSEPGEVAGGMAVRSRQRVTDFRASDAVIQRLVAMSRPAAEPVGIETGIKVIDLFAPLVDGGTVAVVGARNVGKIVVVQELARRLTASGQRATILVFVQSPDELGAIHQLDVRIDGTVTVVAVPVADASPDVLASGLQQVDTVLAMSRELGVEQMYPAIDPLMSRSIAVEVPALVERAREALRTHPGDGRMRLLRAYLTQPFFVAEPYTGRPGVSVDAGVAAADVARILDGDVSGLTVDGVMMGASLA
ncbi:MAG: sigma-70 family RNA polymerase sigma factor [Thermomicrobiales bacterium]